MSLWNSSVDDRWSTLGLWRERPDQLLSFLQPQRQFFTLKRYGGHEDGSYLLPDLDAWQGEHLEAVYSAGVGNKKEFEDELLRAKGIKSYLLDKSSSAETIRTPMYPGQILEQKWLSQSGSSDSLTLERWVMERSPGNKRNLILSVDIEGAEWTSLAQAATEILNRFAIIVIELHRMQDCGNPAVFRTRIAPMLRKLFANHTAIHAAPNNCCGTTMLSSLGIAMPRTLEVTLVHNEELPQVSISNADTSVPHLDDNFQNQPSKPPLFLVGQWWEQGSNEGGKFRRRAALRDWRKSGDATQNGRVVDDFGDSFVIAPLRRWLSGISTVRLTSLTLAKIDMLGITLRSRESPDFFAGLVVVVAKQENYPFRLFRIQALVRDVKGIGRLRFHTPMGSKEWSNVLVFILGAPIECIEKVEAIGR
jgi:hypothetical protein